MRKILLINLTAFLLLSCEHRGQDISNFTGEYRYYAGIAEFFDCKKHIKYYVANKGIYSDLQNKYLQLGLDEKDDAYIKVKGYLKEEKQIEGIHPAIVFVPVKFISFDKNRGCEQGVQQGR
jgi:hypothetical protein